MRPRKIWCRCRRRTIWVPDELPVCLPCFASASLDLQRAWAEDLVSERLDRLPELRKLLQAHARTRRKLPR